MADIKSKYPNADTIALTLNLASLSSDTNLLSGRASTAVDNRTNLDLDHLLSGVIRVGTSPTGGQIEVYVYAPIQIVSSTITYPDGITGTDANKTLTSANVKIAAVRHVQTLFGDTTSSRDHSFSPRSIAALFGGSMPQLWGAFVTHSTGVSLNATQVALQYTRVQTQTV